MPISAPTSTLTVARRDRGATVPWAVAIGSKSPRTARGFGGEEAGCTLKAVPADRFEERLPETRARRRLEGRPPPSTAGVKASGIANRNPRSSAVHVHASDVGGAPDRQVGTTSTERTAGRACYVVPIALDSLPVRNVLTYRTRAQPGNVRNLADAEFVVPKDPTRWLLFGPTGRPWCGIDRWEELSEL